VNGVVQRSKLLVDVGQVGATSTGEMSPLDIVNHFMDVVGQLVEFSDVSLDVTIRGSRVVRKLVNVLGFGHKLAHVAHQVSVGTGIAVMGLEFSLQISALSFDLVSEANDRVLTAGL
jgi:hypothetical protein